MVVGVCAISLLVPESASRKDKRRAVKGLLVRLRNEFGVSAAEVGNLELWQRTAIGLALVSNDSKTCDQMLDKAVEFVKRQNSVELLDYKVEMR